MLSCPSADLLLQNEPDTAFRTRLRGRSKPRSRQLPLTTWTRRRLLRMSPQLATRPPRLELRPPPRQLRPKAQRLVRSFSVIRMRPRTLVLSYLSSPSLIPPSIVTSISWHSAAADARPFPNAYTDKQTDGPTKAPAKRSSPTTATNELTAAAKKAKA